MTQSTYTCLLCGRNRFTRKTPHWCNRNYRKHGIEWKLNSEDMSENNKEFKEAFQNHITGLNELQLKGVEELKEKAKQKEEEIRSIAEDFQKECHLMISTTVQRSTKDVSYQDGTNAWLFYKLAQLSYEIKELKK